MYELIVVMPVYNEEGCIASVVREWTAMLDSLNMDYQLMVLNDGSKDKTGDVLSAFSSDQHIRVINKPNSGHGPTILQGYRMACEEAAWVFQCDSDGEMSPDAFPVLWEKREGYDALFGYRNHRIQSRGRAFISAVSRMTVRLFFGPGVHDVNTPYRLIRANVLKTILLRTPDDTFAPNIIISGELVRQKHRVFKTPVATVTRATGRSSIVKWKLWKAAVHSFWQTWCYFALSSRI
ncbi:MAG: glycosyltransferase family 2 protein [Kiritimatiellae bacterium]|nr:glycosyltransferase family 2 protein [Kiritimatiellia bacterium]MDD4735258.1 glycosyltransferase family 2 protein [Kiritimatiellia bacterium]